MGSRLRGQSTPRLGQKGSGERHPHCANMQNTLGYKNILGLAGKHPSHGNKVLGVMTESPGNSGKSGTGRMYHSVAITS